MGQTLRYQSAAGDTDAYLAPARPSPGPPVLLLHAWWGLTEMIRDLADRLAEDGFTVLAPDLFDGTVLSTIEDATAHQQRVEADEVSADRLLGRVTAGLDHLLAQPDVRGERAAVVAFSFGAWYAAQMAAARPEVASLVNYYGGIGGDVPDGPEDGSRPAYLATLPKTTRTRTIRRPCAGSSRGCRTRVQDRRLTCTPAPATGSPNRIVPSTTRRRASSRTAAP